PKLNRYYKGISECPEGRLTEHNTAVKPTAYTAVTNDWVLIFQLTCEDKTQALKIERYWNKSANVRYLKRFMTETELQDAILLRFKKLIIGHSSSRRVVTGEGAKAICIRWLFSFMAFRIFALPSASLSPPKVTVSTAGKAQRPGNFKPQR
ncbi:MAG: GIY-YIG nuclease family protein, partial [Bacteroidia bacterium]|nr:GIY-YIG nuclease family protein [Bacteroidia bacterium]